MANPRTALLFPRGTYKATPFFFRGDDEFKEREHLQSESTMLQSNLLIAKKSLESTRQEFYEVQFAFNEKEGQTVKIATSLPQGPYLTTEHARLRRRVLDLIADLEEVQRRIEEARQRAQLTTIGQLERERTEYFLNIESLGSDMREVQHQIENSHLDMFQLLSGDSWREASAAAIEHQIADRIHDTLKGQVKRAFEDQNYGDRQPPPMKAVVDAASPDFTALQDLLQRRMEAEQACEHARFQRTCAQIRRRVTVAAMLDGLSRLDEALRDAGDQGVDIEDLRKRHLPEGALSPVKRPRVISGIARVRAGRLNTDIKQSTRARKR
jgi:hypothetical protein